MSKLIAHQLWGISASDPAVFLGVILIVGLAALVACVIPAIHATTIDPMAALRTGGEV